MDIYFKKEYGKLYEKMENGKMEEFNLNTEYGSIKNIFIKREIPINIDNEKYHDLITPYGYGGPIIINCSNEESKEKLLAEYNEKFKKYAMENNIVSEFIRFHPVLKNYKDFGKIYNTQYMRKTVGTNLKDYDNPFQKEFSRSTRKRVRRLLKDGVRFEIVKSPNNLDKFIEIYYETMDRNNAEKYYYFRDEYFNNLIKNFKSNIILVNVLYKGEIIGAELNLVYGKMIHGHLAGALDKYLDLSPGYIGMYGINVWGKENGYELLHVGGGTSNSENDTLLKFKRKFGANTEFDFYIGKKIWNKDIYNQLCNVKGIDKDIDFFPAYRSSR